MLRELVSRRSHGSFHEPKRFVTPDRHCHVRDCLILSGGLLIGVSAHCTSLGAGGDAGSGVCVKSAAASRSVADVLTGGPYALRDVRVRTASRTIR